MKYSAKFWALIAVFFLIGVLISQNNSIPDPLTQQVGDLLSAEKYEEVVALLQPALEPAAKSGNWEKYAEYATTIAKALKKKNDFMAADAGLSEALKVVVKAGKGETLSAAKLWMWQAMLKVALLQHADALSAYLIAIGIFEQHHFNGPNLAFCYKNAAQIYNRYSSNQEAINYLEKALRSDSTQQHSVSIYSALASSYFFIDSMERSEQYFQLALAKMNPDDKYAGSVYSIGASLALHKGHPAEAKEYALLALAYYQKIKVEGENRVRTLTDLADIANHTGNLGEAIQYFQKAEALGKEFFKQKKSREMAKLYIETGLFYEKHQQPDRALQFYQQALVQAFPNFNSLDPADNPPIETAWLEIQAMRAATAKAQILLKPKQWSAAAKKPTAPGNQPEILSEERPVSNSIAYQEPTRGGDHSTHNFKAVGKQVSIPKTAISSGQFSLATRQNAAHCFNLAFAVAARLRHTYGNDTDKQALASSNRDALNDAVRNLLEIHRLTNDPQHLEHLLALLEQTRATALADALQQQRALALTGIPDSLLRQEQSLRLESAYLAKSLKNPEMDQDSADIARQKENLFSADKAYADLLARLRTQYPQFGQYADADHPSSLADIRAALPDSAALLSWFDAGDRYLCVVLKHQTLAVFEITRDAAFDHALGQFLAVLSDRNQQEQSPAAYFVAAFSLGSRLLPPAALADVKSLVIVPDGQLSYLPFEALLTAQHTGAYANAPYLLRSHTVRYAWSASLLALPPIRRAEGHGMLHFAPFLSAAHHGHVQLAQSLHDRPEGLRAEVLTDDAATAASFLQKAPDCAVVHLSTHASAGGESLPGIEFGDRQLTMPEIYAQRFHAALVSLSACETGAGQFAEGEGVLSLARAFAYAGARSLVASHWAVNDRSTAALFSAFYRQLKNGTSEAEALRQSKLAYLNSGEMDARKAPYHWAAFTLTGADEVVDFGDDRWLIAAMGTLLVLTLLGVWWLWRVLAKRK